MMTRIKIALLAGLLASLLAGCGIARGTPATSAPPAVSPSAKADHQALYVGFAGALIAFRASDGTILRTHKNNGGFLSPVVGDGMLYTGASTEAENQLLALRASDGSVVWKTTLDRPTWATPTLSDGILYATAVGSVWSSGGPSSSLYALDARTGRIMWRFQTAGNLSRKVQVIGDAIYASIEATNNGVGGYHSTVVAINRSDGSVRWRTPIEGEISELCIANGAIYFSVYDKTLIALNTATGAPLWRHSTPDWVVWITTSGGDVFYAGMDAGEISALRAKNGATIWTSSLEGHFDHYVDPSVTIQDGLMYVGSLSGFVAVLDATTGATRWRVCLGNESCATPTASTGWSTPLVADGTIYLGVTYTDRQNPHPPGGSAGGVYALDATTGGVRWQYQRFGGEVGTPALASITG